MLVVLIVLLCLGGAVIYFNKPKLGITMSATGFLAAIYTLFIRKQKAEMVGRGMWDTISEVGGKWIDMVGVNTKTVLDALNENPDLIGQVTKSLN